MKKRSLKNFIKYRYLELKEYLHKRKVYKTITSEKWEYRDLFSKEIEWLVKNKSFACFPYDFPNIKYISEKDVFFDEEEGLFYVLREDDNRLYWRRKNREVAFNGYNGMIFEQSPRNPHRYFTDTFFPREDEIFIDVGCAEGKEALDIIDKVKEIYLFEASPDWNRPLHLSFDKFKEKVHIINAFVSDRTDREKNLVSISDYVDDKDSLLIKIDVEGEELNVLKGMEKILDRTNVRIVLAAYHKRDDNIILKEYLESKGFICEYSDNWMLYEKSAYEPLYFVRGVIRAWK